MRSLGIRVLDEGDQPEHDRGETTPVQNDSFSPFDMVNGTVRTAELDENGERVSDPDMKVRVYLDGQMAESMSFSGEHRHAELRRLCRAHRHELDKRWRRNILLNKWLEFLMDRGHLVLER